MIERHAPIVYFKHADLRKPEEPRLVFDIEIFLLALAAADGDLLDRVTHTLHGVALEEAILVAALWAAHEADRSVDDVRKDVGRNRLIVGREVKFGDPDIWIEDLVGARELDPTKHRIAFGLRFATALLLSHIGLLVARSVASYVNRPLILAQALKARMPQPSIAGPLGEGDLRDKSWFKPHRALPLLERHLHERRLCAFERLELARKRIEIGIIEAGADLTGIDQLAVFEAAEQQRREGLASHLGPAGTADDEFP